MCCVVCSLFVCAMWLLFVCLSVRFYLLCDCGVAAIAVDDVVVGTNKIK